MWLLKVTAWIVHHGRRDVFFRCVGVRDRQRENKKGGWNGVIYMSVHHWVKIISLQTKNNFVCLERREGIQNFFVFWKESNHLFNGKLLKPPVLVFTF